MLMAKLKVCAALAAAAMLLGVGGLAYQAAGQAPAPRPEKNADVRLERGAGARDLTELELLRKEVDILKLQVEVLQQQVRGLRGEGGAKAKEAPADTGRRYTDPVLRDGQRATERRPPYTGDLIGRPPGADTKRPPAADKADTNRAPEGERFEGRPAEKAPLSGRGESRAKPLADDAAAQGLRDLATNVDAERRRREKPADAVSQVEAAVKALREARDPEARRRATDALERAVRNLRGRPPESGKPSGAPGL
jgi:hypothetical protein